MIWRYLNKSVDELECFYCTSISIVCVIHKWDPVFNKQMKHLVPSSDRIDETLMRLKLRTFDPDDWMNYRGANSFSEEINVEFMKRMGIISHPI